MLEEEMQTVPERQQHIVQQHLVLLGAADDVDGHVRLHLVQDYAVVKEEDVAVLLGRLGQERLFEAGLGRLVGVGVLGGCGTWDCRGWGLESVGLVVEGGGKGERTSCYGGDVWWCVVFGVDSGAIVAGEND